MKTKKIVVRPVKIGSQVVYFPCSNAARITLYLTKSPYLTTVDLKALELLGFEITQKKENENGTF
jgi:hypothetical protein